MGYITDAFYMAMQKVAKVSMDNMVLNANDIEEDGITYCGICGEAKTGWIEYDGREKIKMAIQCRCTKAFEEAEEKERKERERRSRIGRLRASSGIPEIYKEAKFDDLIKTGYNAKNIRICKAYSEKFSELLKKNTGLVLWGDKGTGKSMIAACIANELIMQGYSVYMTTAAKIVEEEEAIRNASLLIIDDLGAERKTDYAAEKVLRAIDDRYGSGKPMIITTNMTKDEMENEPDLRYSRMYDRIFQNCVPLQFTGPSFRTNAIRRDREEINALLGIK